MYLIKENSTGYFQSENALLDDATVIFPESKAVAVNRLVGVGQCECCGEEVMHFEIGFGTILTIDSSQVIKPKLAA